MEAQDLLDASLWNAVKDNNTTLVLEKLAMGAKPDRIFEGISALHEAIGHRNHKLFAAMLKADVNVNVKTVVGYTLLHYAAVYSQPEILGLLLARGADASLVEGAQKTPLDLARTRKDKECIALLERHMLQTAQVVTLRSAFADTGREMVEVYDFKKRERQSALFNKEKDCFEGSLLRESFDSIRDKTSIGKALEKINAQGGNVDPNVVYHSPDERRKTPLLGAKKPNL